MFFSDLAEFMAQVLPLVRERYDIQNVTFNILILSPQKWRTHKKNIRFQDLVIVFRCDLGGYTEIM